MTVDIIFSSRDIVKNPDESILFLAKRQNNLYKIDLGKFLKQSASCLVSIKEEQWIDRAESKQGKHKKGV